MTGTTESHQARPEAAGNGAAQAAAELAADAFVCINCGAPVTFASSNEAGDETELEQAACAYCDVVNDRALAMLRARSAKARHDELHKKKRAQGIRLLAAAALASALLLGSIAAFNTRSQLGGAYAEVQRAHAQVANVSERQRAVVKRYAAAPAGPDRDAELSGAENRVRIERARHDKAATAYNALLGSPWARMVASMFDLPKQVPLSSEAHW